MDRSDFITRLNAADRFCVHNNIRLLRAENGCSEAELVVTPESMNAGGVVQGGAIFTLADFTFAGAANSYGRHCVVQCASINFLRPGLGKELRASAEIRFVGRRTCFGDVSIVSDEGKLIAQGQYTGCFVGE